ncbi:MAG: TMEM143 family protein [Pseudomonadota bacterium]
MTDVLEEQDPLLTRATDLDRLRFIPFRRTDLVRMLRSSGHCEPTQLEAFEEGVQRIDSMLAGEFHAFRRDLKDAYAAFDPDADTRTIRALSEDDAPIGASNDAALDAKATALSAQLKDLLNRANYEVLTDRDLKRAFRSASLFQIRLKVNLKDYSDVLLYCRGGSERAETIKVFGLFKRDIRFVNYERVLLYLRFAGNAPVDEGMGPGRVMIKLFQHVPDADLEMLFPNTQVAMRWIDRLLIGVPALASGAVVAFTKLGAPLLLLGALLGYWLGLQAEPVELDKKGLLVLSAGAGALTAYLWKQWSSYRNRKARFRQTLTRSLYFKLLDNNAGALLRILDDGEDSECKEAYAVYYFLLAAGGRASVGELDAAIERWFEETWSARLDFEIEDALAKLERVGLAHRAGDEWRLASGSEADGASTESDRSVDSSTDTATSVSPPSSKGAPTSPAS